MRALFTLALFAAFWTGMAGQDLPFTIQVTDINTRTTGKFIQKLVPRPGYYLLTDTNGCLYTGAGDRAPESVRCDADPTKALVETESGTFVVSNDASQDSNHVFFWRMPRRKPRKSFLGLRMPS